MEVPLPRPSKARKKAGRRGGDTKRGLQTALTARRLPTLVRAAATKAAPKERRDQRRLRRMTGPVFPAHSPSATMRATCPACSCGRSGRAGRQRTPPNNNGHELQTHSTRATCPRLFDRDHPNREAAIHWCDDIGTARSPVHAAWSATLHGKL